MRKFLILSLCCFLLAGCHKYQLPPQTIKLGAVAELTGSIPLVGASSKNAALLAVKQINAAGGITIAGKKYPIELIIEDNANQAAQTITVVNRLIQEDDVLAIIGPNASVGAIPAAKIAEENKTILITPWSTNPDFGLSTETGRPNYYAFRVCFTDPFAIEALAQFAFNTLHLKKMATLYDNASPAPTTQAQLFDQAFTKFGGKIVSTQTYASGDKNFIAQLQKIKAARPQAIFLPAYYNDVPLITQQARKLGIKALFLGSDNWESPNLPKITQGAAEGSYLIGHYDPTAKAAATQQFVQAYKKAYGEIPDDVAALTYDAYQVIFKALAGATSLDRDALRDSMATLGPIQGATGVIEYTNRSGDPIKPVVIFKLKAQRFVLVKTITSTANYARSV